MTDVNAATRLQAPSHRQLARYASLQQLGLSADEVEEERKRVASLLRVFDEIGGLEEPVVPVRYPDRDAGRLPTGDEDPYGAVVRVCTVKGAATGPLAGTRVGVKDNIAVASVPMTSGRPSTREVMTPVEDATAVERLLDAGAAIVAKTSVGTFASGGADNPLNPRYSAGFSSSGSAAAVAGGIVDVALGVDQAGSIRWPASWCGLVGMKATYGLVPTYGLAYSDHTIDHIGPISRTVAENAAMLEVIAGSDWRSPQQVALDAAPYDYTTALSGQIDGIRIGVITESVSPSRCNTDTRAAFVNAQRILSGLGARTVPVSLPLWNNSFAIWLAGATFHHSAMSDALGQGYGHRGRLDVHRLVSSATQAQVNGREPRTMLLLREFLHDAYLGTPYARAQNLRVELRRQVDSLFREVDVLISPTSPTGPAEVPTREIDLAELATAGDGVLEPPLDQASPILACCAFNLTGHPALTVHSGKGDDGMPRGLQIIGKCFDERTVYRVGSAFEAATT